MPVRKLVGLGLSIALLLGGAALTILWDHPLSVIWQDPVSLLWSDNTRDHSSPGRLWMVGPYLLIAGLLWVYSDWFERPSR